MPQTVDLRRERIGAHLQGVESNPDSLRAHKHQNLLDTRDLAQLLLQAPTAGWAVYPRHL